MTITVAKSRLPLIVRVAAAAVLVAASLAACGSAASTSRPGAQASTPGGANPPVAGATGDPVLTGAAAQLNGLDSYKYSLSMKGGTTASSMGCSGNSGTVVNKPTFAIDTVRPGDTITPGADEMIRTHDKAWTKFDSGRWVAEVGVKTFAGTDWPADANYWPSSLLTHLNADSFTAAGSETVNGVATTHYTRSDPTRIQGAGAMGFRFYSGSSPTEDVWIATAGGYPVRWKLTATGSSALEGSCNSSDFEFLLDITNANDAGNVVVLPS